MNILVLVSDAMRARNLGCYGYDKNTSPCIDEIARRGILFKNAFSTINTTGPSFTTIFTGKYPSTHGIRRHGPQLSEAEKSYTPRLRFLPEILKDNGYVTMGLDWLGFWHKRGYDYYAGRPNNPTNHKSADSQNPRGPLIRFMAGQLLYLIQMGGRCNWYYSLPEPLRDIVRSYAIRLNSISQADFSRKKMPLVSDSAGLSDLVIRYIKEYAGRKKFFIFVHYWDTHIPYTGPHSVAKRYYRDYKYSTRSVASVFKELGGAKAEKLVRKSVRGRLPKTVGGIKAQYDASITYTDRNIGRIYQALDNLGILEDTLIIITADHGESLDEHGIYFSHHGLYDTDVHIPLIMQHPRLGSGAVYEQLVQHVDVVPTILELAGIDYKNEDFDGQSLLKIVDGGKWDRQFVYAEELACMQRRMIRDNKYKYIRAMDDEKCRYCERYHVRGDEFFDLQADPCELRNIINDPRSEFYKKMLNEYIASIKPVQPGEKVQFDDEELVNQRLKSLGYF
ncbi:MAG: sulfatase [Phycisphaerae bacterium]